MINKIFDENGNLNIKYIITHIFSTNDKVDFLSNNESNDAGLEILSYAFQTKWKEIKKIIDSDILSKEEMIQVNENLYNTTHEYMLKYRKYLRTTKEGTDFSQYDETKTRIDLKDEDRIRQIHRYLFSGLVSGLEKSEYIKTKTKNQNYDRFKYYISWIEEMYNKMPESLKHDPIIIKGVEKVNQIIHEYEMNQMKNDINSEPTTFYQAVQK